MDEFVRTDDNVSDIQEVNKESFDWKKYLRITLLVLRWTIIGFFGSTVLVVVLFSFINPPVTPLMVTRACIKTSDDTRLGIEKKWVRIEDISPYMIDAVVASEDNRFLSHWGIDMGAIQKATEWNKSHQRKRGASTITQQVAKNVFLWPARTWVRKGFELYFTVLIETVWSKKRIMEVYLNIIETGNGLYGVEAAAQKYFHKSAAKLSSGEAALIAISLPNPRVRNPARPSAYMLTRQSQILSLMRKIGSIDL